MSFPAHFLPAVLLTLLTLPISLAAQTTPKQISKVAHGSISGRVTIKDKGAAGVLVTLRKNEAVNPYEPFQRATTDQEGFYQITGVAPGAYEVVPAAPAFVPVVGVNGQKPVVLGEDENIEDVNFTLVRGGVITGKVTDGEGRPLVQQQVFIFNADAFDQQARRPQVQPPIFPTKSGVTDDRGIYRVFGLMPGRYKVAAGRGDNVYNGSMGYARAVYKQVFHPDVNEADKATVIEVGEGTEANNVDIAMGRPLQIFSASGRVVDGENDQPVPNIRFGLQRNLGQRFEFVNPLSMTNAKGQFTIEGLTPGKYGFFMFPNENSSMRMDNLTFDIVDQDVSGITVKLVKGASLSGTVVLESENKTALAKLSELQLRAYVQTGPGGVGTPSSAVSSIGPDGKFQISGLAPGTAMIMLGAKNGPYPPPGFSITRIERDGVIAPRGIEIKSGEQLAGIRIVLAYGTASLRGVVTIENGVLAEGARIFVKVTKPGDEVSNLRQAQADARGHFVLEGLPTGTWDVIAWVIGMPQAPFCRVKREVAIQDGVVTDITLTIDMNPPAKP